MSWRRSATALARSFTAAPTPFAARSIASTSSSSSPASAPTTTTAAPTTVSRPELHAEHLRYLKSLSQADLAAFDPVLDVHPSKQFSPRLPSKNNPHQVHVTLMNDTPNNRGYQQPRPSPDLLDGLPGEDDAVSHLAQLTHLSTGEIRGLYRFPLVVKRVVTMKSKGKMPSMYSLVVVGNGRGLVGVGEGKDDTANKAVQKAFNQAVRSMDYVERYEDRTVSGTMKSNFGTCKIEMRSRPPGFGLRVNPYIHQVAKAAGITDLSAKVYGSRNATRVIKLAVSMLHGGSNPIDMGGFGKEKGQRRNKKTSGMETAEAVGRARGRRAVDVSGA
ncbi:mitochondrial 37S ribosomal protein uS5m MRPS5 [Sporobolomyces koalae]|uniref:mitochondrial 37S ribosomal protein uS5m MRPS5 n=1 Tax=Sporobolomyces koalae TaxID=500713 RepID=UPI0031707F3D